MLVNVEARSPKNEVRNENMEVGGDSKEMRLRKT